MVDWWNTLTALERCFAYIAIPATLILAIQTLLLLFGLGHDSDGDSGDVHWGGEGIDLDGDGIPDGYDMDGDGLIDSPPDDVSGHEITDAGLRIFTVRGFVAFFSVFGWCGLALLKAGTNSVAAALISLCLGLAAMLAIALILHFALRLQADGTLNLRNALGACGNVYLTIPPARQGVGKVTAVVQEQLGEFDAVTDDAEAITTGCEVVVVGITGKSTLVVCRK